MESLTEIQQKVVHDILRLGLSQAQSQLEELTHAQLTIHVQRIELLSRVQLNELLNHNTAQHFVAINQTFRSSFSGCSTLLIKHTHSDTLVQRFIKDQNNASQLASREIAVLCELGNIVLNAGISAFSSMLEVPIESTLPSCTKGDFATLQSACQYFNHHDDQALTVWCQLDLDKQVVQFQLMYFLKLSAHMQLTDLIDTYINRICPAAQAL